MIYLLYFSLILLNFANGSHHSEIYEKLMQSYPLK